MLTDAQYKALKSWPDAGGYVCGVSSATCECLLRAGLFRKANDYSRMLFKKVKSTCDDAISEYEAAQADVGRDSEMR